MLLQSHMGKEIRYDEKEMDASYWRCGSRHGMVYFTAEGIPGQSIPGEFNSHVSQSSRVTDGADITWVRYQPGDATLFRVFQNQIAVALYQPFLWYRSRSFENPGHI